MSATFRFRLGPLDLSNYVKVNPDDKLDMQGAPWVEPAYAETPFSDGQALISTTVHNREQLWPVFLKNAPGAAAVTNFVPTPKFGRGLDAWATTGFGSLNAGAAITQVTDAATPSGAGQSMQVVTTNALNFEGAAILVPGTFLTGQPYKISAFIRGNAGGEAIRLGGADNSTGDGQVSNVTLSAAYQRISFTYTPIADHTNFYVFVATNGAAAVTFFVDAVMVSAGATLQSYGDGDSAGWLWNGPPGNSTSSSLVGKDGLHQLIRAINNAAAQRPLTVEWRDDSASASTFYDVSFVRFDPDFNFRRSVHGYAAGVLHVFTSGYGHTGTTRVTATAAGTGIFLSVPIPSVAGDAPALLDTTIVSGAVLPSLGRIVALAPIVQPSYTPRIPAASLTDLQANATLTGASGADGSQMMALPVSPTGGASGVACKVPLPNPTIAGGDNRILAVVKSGIDAGVGMYALDPFGNAMGPTTVASMSQGWGLVDLGVCRLPTVGFPTQPKVSIYGGGIWASGAAGPNVLASPGGLQLNEILCLPDKNLTLLYERGAGGSVLSKDGFAGAAALNGQNDNQGNPWSQAWNNTGATPNLLTEGGNFLDSAAVAASSIDSSHLAGILSDSMLISGKAIFQTFPPSTPSAANIRLFKESASGAYVQARLGITAGANYELDLAAATSGTLNTLASLALATLSLNAKYRLLLQVQGPAGFVNVSRDDGGPVFIPGSAAYASVGVASNAAVAGAGVPALALAQTLSAPAGVAAGLAAILQSWEVDTIPTSSLQTFDSYRIDGPNADAYRTSSAGVFAGNKLVSVQRGAFPKMVPSAVSLAVVCAPVDQGAANDLISAAVSVRERYTYGR